MRQLTGLLASAVLVTFVATAAWSSEADELRAKAKAMQRESDQLRKKGHDEESVKLSRAAKELLQAAEKHDAKPSKESDREIDELHQQLKALAEKEQHAEKSKNKEALTEVRKHRAGVERQLAERREQHERKLALKHGVEHSPKMPEPLQEAARRLKHLHIAVENLHAAGMHDVAEELAKRAEGMQRELQHAHEQFEKEQSSSEKRKHVDLEHKHEEPKGKFAPGHAPDEELRHEVKRLRVELNELREEIKKRP